MTLIPPHTWIPGEVWTAALGNTYIRDAILETMAAKVTAAGQLAVSDGPNNIVPIAHPGAPDFELHTIGVNTVGWREPREKYLYKTVDESRSSTSFGADSHILFLVEANKTYFVEIYPILSGPSAADMQFSWLVPAGATFFTTALNSDGGTWFGFGGQANSTMVTATTDATQRNYPPLIATIKVGSTAGLVALIWAQGVANASPVTLHTGTFARVTRVN